MLFISYRRSDTSAYADWISEWLEESLPVSEVFYDRDTIEAADNWRERIAQVIPHCEGMLVLIGPNWLGPRLFEPDDTVCKEVAIALTNSIPVIPVLVDGATMPTDKQLPNAICKLSDYNALALRVGRDNRIRDWERLRKTIESKTGKVIRPRNLPEADRSRNTLLRLVREQIKDGKRASLKGVPFIDLDLAEQPGAITPPYYRMYPSETPVDLIPLTQGTTIVDVYRQDGHPGSLLVLGKPGAGKSTLLLELGEWLVREAERDTSRDVPIPILLNLASWQNDPQNPKTLKSWLVEEIHERYQLPKSVADTIVRSLPMVLLLDGLDEVIEESRASCVDQVNAYLKDSRQEAHVVISCRIDEYFAIGVSLTMDRGLQVQPLTPKQIDEFLACSTPVLDHLQKVLQDNEQLAELAAIPLWLNLMAIVFREKISSENISHLSQDELQFILIDLYIENRLNPDLRPRSDGLQKGEVILHKTKEKGKEPSFLYSKQEARDWLSWIARHLGREQRGIIDLIPRWGMNSFRLEHIEPGEVHQLRRLRLFYFAMLWSSLGPIIGLILGLLLANIDVKYRDRVPFSWTGDVYVWLRSDIELQAREYFSWRGLFIGFGSGVVLAIAFALWLLYQSGLMSSIVDNWGDRYIYIHDRWHFSWKLFAFGCCVMPVGMLAYYLLGRFGIVDSGGYKISIYLIIGIITGPFVGILWAFMSGVDEDTPDLDKVVHYRTPNLGIIKTGKRGFVAFLVVGGIFGFLFSSGFGLFGVLGGLVFGLPFGFGDYLKYWITRSIQARENLMPRISFWFWLRRCGVIDERNIDLIIKHDPYIRFLYDMVDRNLLQTLGNGFAFIHPLLRDHFESLEISALHERVDR